MTDESRRDFIKFMAGGVLVAGATGLGLNVRAKNSVFGGNAGKQASSQGSERLPPSTGSPYWEGHFFPLLLVNAGMSSPSIDPLWTQFMQGMGVKGLRFQTDLNIFQKYQSRYENAFGLASSAGLPVHLVNTIDVSGYNQIIGVAPDFLSTPPTWTTFLNQNMETIEAFMATNPSMVSVLTEPQDINNRLRANFSESQYASAVKQMTSTIKNASPSTVTCLKILYDSKFDIQTAKSCLNDPNLDIIALDIYGANNGTTFSPTGATNLAEGIRFAGKKVGVGETWKEPIFELPNLDQPSDEAGDAAWITQIGTWAIANGATSTFLPFYTNKFVSSSPMVDPLTYQGGVAYWSQVQQALENEQNGKASYQPTYQAYDQIILG